MDGLVGDEMWCNERVTTIGRKEHEVVKVVEVMEVVEVEEVLGQTCTFMLMTTTLVSLARFLKRL